MMTHWSQGKKKFQEENDQQCQCPRKIKKVRTEGVHFIEKLGHYWWPAEGNFTMNVEVENFEFNL